MQPDDLSLPRGDNNIKEKLNLHLKKRLMETGKGSSAVIEPPLSSSTCPPVSPAISSAPGPSPGTKTKKQKTKHSPSTSTVSNSAGTAAGIAAAAGSGSSKNENLLLSPGALGGGNSNDTTNSSFNSVDLDPDANLSNDGQDRSTSEKSSSKTNSKPDIFAMILNEKKSSLMRDPEVIKFLKEIMDNRDKS